MIIVILAMIICASIMALLSEYDEILVFAGIVLGAILGFVAAIVIGSSLPTITIATVSELSPIYGEGTQTYLKSIDGDGSKRLLYHINEDGVPREGVITIGSGSVEVLFDLTGNEVPYVENEEYKFRDDWMRLFAFGPGGSKNIFHIPVGGVDIDINDLLK